MKRRAPKVPEILSNLTIESVDLDGQGLAVVQHEDRLAAIVAVVAGDAVGYLVDVDPTGQHDVVVRRHDL